MKIETDREFWLRQLKEWRESKEKREAHESNKHDAPQTQPLTSEVIHNSNDGAIE